MAVKFEDYSIQCKGAITDAVTAFLHEAGGELASMAARNQSRRDTGATAGSWTYRVEGGKATVGNPLENAIWEEFGTGEHAEKGNGRKGGWAYEDAKGKWHFTRGKTALRPLRRAFESSKGKIKSELEKRLKGLN